MAAVPGTDTAVATVTPAAGATRTPLAAASEWADWSGGRPPRPSREATLLAMRTAARAAGRPAVAGVAAEAAGSITGSLAADTEMDLRKEERRGLGLCSFFFFFFFLCVWFFFLRSFLQRRKRKEKEPRGTLKLWIKAKRRASYPLQRFHCFFWEVACWISFIFLPLPSCMVVLLPF